LSSSIETAEPHALAEVEKQLDEITEPLLVGVIVAGTAMRYQASEEFTQAGRSGSPTTAEPFVELLLLPWDAATGTEDVRPRYARMDAYSAWASLYILAISCMRARTGDRLAVVE
jgi:hypothetical protein